MMTNLHSRILKIIIFSVRNDYKVGESMNSKNNMISIVVPCFNSGFFLAECIASILASKIKCLVEVIIVDDGSTDDITLDLLGKFMSLDNVIVERLPHNHGVQYARNIGIVKSNGNFLMTLDSDDKLHNNIDGGSYIDEAINVLENDFDVAFVHCYSEMFGEYSGMTISSYPLNEDLIVSKHHVPTSIIYRKSDLDTGDNYLLGLQKWQDWSFGVKILANRWANNLFNKIYAITRPHHQYRVHFEWARISYSNVNEYEMTLMTIIDSIRYFQSLMGSESAEHIAKTVLAMKPLKVNELCHIANHDVVLAYKIIHERKFRLESSNVDNRIP